MSKIRKVLIVVNPAAGRSLYAHKLEHLKSELSAINFQYELFFTPENNEKSLSFMLKDQKSSVDEIYVMGGDGTLNYVVNEIKDFPLPVNIVSNGTGNDSVKSLHGELNFKKQVSIATEGVIKNFDLGICNNRRFVNGVGIGFDGMVVKEMKEKGNKRGRHIDYLMTVLKIISGFKEEEISFKMDEEHLSKKIFLMTISNGTTFGGGFIINPMAIPDDGLLDICIFNEISVLKRFWHLPKLRKGNHVKVKETEFHRFSQITIEENDQLVAHLDGEFIGHPPFNISIEKGALRTRVPL